MDGMGWDWDGSPGGRGYRAPYGANKASDLPPPIPSIPRPPLLVKPTKMVFFAALPYIT